MRHYRNHLNKTEDNLLITLEGIDGCGKSTQIPRIEALFKKNGYEVEVLREPGGTPLSEQIRAILLNSSEDIHPVAETLLFSAARSQLVANRIRPLLEAGTIVILDRFYDSTTAYQGYGRGALAAEEIEALNRMATDNLKPDVTFYLRIAPSLAVERRKKAGEEDRMERAGIDFFERVSNGFDQIASREERFVTIDAAQSPDQIYQLIETHLKKKLPHSQ